MAHLGTIAKSGTREFMAKLEGDQKKDANLIGQFGVGFYSGFIVADRITVESRRAGLPADEGVRWSSEGTGDFEVETITRAERGTDVILHLRDDEEEFLHAWKLQVDHRQVLRPHLAADPDAQGGVGRARRSEQVVTDEWETGQQGRGAVDARQERHHRRAVPGVLQADQLRHRGRRWPTRTTASRAAPSTRSCSTSRPRRRSTCGTATSAAASSSTSSASSSWTTPRR